MMMVSSRVLVVAPGHSVRGGITSVVRTHSGLGVWQRWRCSWIETLDDRSRAGAKLAVAVTALLQFARAVPYAQIVHIHVAWKNSAVRKFPFFALSKILRRTTIVHWHAPDADEAMNGIRGAILRMMLRRADSVVVLSEYWRRVALERIGIAPERTTIVPNPVLIGGAVRQPEPATILFLGKLEDRKGVETLIRAFQRVRETRPSATLRLAGDNVAYLEKFTPQELENVRALGWVAAKEVAAELARATCLCLPSRGEGVPMAVLEAMAAGCPTVATLAGGLADVMRHEDNGFVVRVDDVDGLAECLNRVLKDGSARDHVAQTAARYVSDTHGLDRVDRLLSELYARAEERK